MSAIPPDGWPTVVPRMFVDDVGGVVAFLKLVFGASGEVRADALAEMWIGDSVIMVSDGGGARQARPTFLYVYVENAFNGRSRRGLLQSRNPPTCPTATGALWCKTLGATSGKSQLTVAHSHDPPKRATALF